MTLQMYNNVYAYTAAAKYTMSVQENKQIIRRNGFHLAQKSHENYVDGPMKINDYTTYFHIK